MASLYLSISLSQVLTKYKWESGEPAVSSPGSVSEEDGLASGPLNQDLAVLVQSIVMAVQGKRHFMPLMSVRPSVVQSDGWLLGCLAYLVINS